MATEQIQETKGKNDIKLKGVIPPEPMAKERRREIGERVIGAFRRLGLREEIFGDLICGESDYDEQSNVSFRE